MRHTDLTHSLPVVAYAAGSLSQAVPCQGLLQDVEGLLWLVVGHLWAHTQEMWFRVLGFRVGFGFRVVCNVKTRDQRCLVNVHMIDSTAPCTGLLGMVKQGHLKQFQRSRSRRSVLFPAI